MPSRGVPNWGPPIPPSTSELHRINVEGALNDSYSGDASLPGVGRLAPPPPRMRSQHHASSPSQRRYHNARTAAASSSSDISSDDDDEYPRALGTRESTGNHAALAASSTIGPSTNRRKAQRLPERALERLDRWAAAAAAASSSRAGPSAHDDSCEPTYIVERPAPQHHRAVASSPVRQPPRQRRRSLSPTPPPQHQHQQQRQASRRGDSSNETLVDAPIHTNAGGYRKAGSVHEDDERVYHQQHRSNLLLPSGVNMGRGAQPPLALPDDVTGVTSALGSPCKTRLGIRHAGLHPKNALVANLPARRKQLSDLKAFVLSIEDELETTKDRLEGVELKEQELRGDFREFEREIRGRGAQGERVQQHHEEARDTEHWQANIAEMARHVQALSLDLKAYRHAVQDLQQPGLPAARMAVAPVSHSEEEYRLLQRQVVRIEEELSRLRSVVDSSGREAKAPSTSTKAAAAAPSVPVLAQPTRRTSPFAAPRPPARVSDAEEEEDGDVTPKASAQPAKAARAHEQEEQPAPRQSAPAPAPAPVSAPLPPRRREPTAQSVRIAEERNHPHNDEEDDMTIAETRVDRTVRHLQQQQHQDEQQSTTNRRAEQQHQDRPLPPLDLAHDAETCTVCSSRAKSDARRASRKQRIAASVRRQESGAVEEELLLSFLGGSGGAAGADESFLSTTGPPDDAHPSSRAPHHLSPSQLSLLSRLLKQHLDEFIHQRLLYSELADEVKRMHPDTMEKRKRRILVDHVVEAVEELEAKARRIEVLRRLMPVGGGVGGGEQKVGGKAGSVRGEKLGKGMAQQQQHVVQQQQQQQAPRRPALSSAKYVNTVPSRGGAAPTLKGVLASVSE